MRAGHASPAFFIPWIILLRGGSVVAAECLEERARG
jgi:hypothetical protein